jgi:hypothetical protein
LDSGWLRGGRAEALAPALCSGWRRRRLSAPQLRAPALGGARSRLLVGAAKPLAPALSSALRGRLGNIVFKHEALLVSLHLASL